MTIYFLFSCYHSQAYDQNVHYVITYECTNSTTAYLVAIGLVFLNPNYRII